MSSSTKPCLANTQMHHQTLSMLCWTCESHLKRTTKRRSRSVDFFSSVVFFLPAASSPLHNQQPELKRAYFSVSEERAAYRESGSVTNVNKSMYLCPFLRLSRPICCSSLPVSQCRIMSLCTASRCRSVRLLWCHSLSLLLLL